MVELSIGIIGLGIMGGAIARNLRSKGWKIFGFDVDRAACGSSRESGVDIMSSSGAVAEAVSIVLTSLPSPAAAYSVIDEISAAARPSCIIVELSTLALHDRFALRDRAEAAGHILLDCPLSGTGEQAKTGDLVVYASGDHGAIERCLPVFKDFARKSFDLGAFGNGTKLKFIANHLVAIHNVASAEAMVLAMTAGLDPKQVVEVIGAGAGSSKVFELRAPLMAANRYEPPTMQLSTWNKDMEAIAGFARSVKAPTPLFDATMSVYAAANSMGYGAQDTAAVCAVLEHLAGITRDK
jgi:3-hydroxyisobutyrate dehydrogenase-like beta-hydroxyacid dehydrogenase